MENQDKRKGKKLFTQNQHTNKVEIKGDQPIDPEVLSNMSNGPKGALWDITRRPIV